ncbi:hypothetical protein MPSEU_000146100 [Mayamaea pseudoterrestris]|nr:hypothetical protein MPSEU_000146100 [Mayamaea pseudoterrestris]
MGERKVISKYIPADFDPALVPKGKKLSSKDGCVPVRMMLPFSVQCSNCSEFLYRGRKFNSKKERMGGPDGVYLGITRWRFYIKCTQCARPLTFLTDPKNCDYEMESGGTRNYEVYKDRDKTEQEALEELEREKKEDPMKALESRVLDSQREMAEMDTLEQIKAMNARHLKLAVGDGFDSETMAVLAAQKQQDNGVTSEPAVVELTADDEALVKSIQFGRQQQHIKRLDEHDEAELEGKRKQQVALFQAPPSTDALSAAVVAKKSLLPVVAVKRRRVNAVAVATESNIKVASEEKKESTGLAGLLGGYGSDSDSD